MIGIVLVAGIGWVAYSKMQQTSEPAVQTAPSGTTSTSTGTAGQYTVADVTAHKDASSCWTIIGGSVYDLTAWIPQHPGGAGAIVGLCGHDGTAAFQGQHDSAKKQADILATFKIGALTQ